jgi:hypothetical protein
MYWQTVATNRGSFKVYLVSKNNHITYLVVSRQGKLLASHAATNITQAKKHFYAHAFTALVGA